MRLDVWSARWAHASRISVQDFLAETIRELPVARVVYAAISLIFNLVTPANFSTQNLNSLCFASIRLFSCSSHCWARLSSRINSCASSVALPRSTFSILSFSASVLRIGRTLWGDDDEWDAERDGEWWVRRWGWTRMVCPRKGSNRCVWQCWCRLLTVLIWYLSYANDMNKLIANYHESWVESNSFQLTK